jgi:hypothetical protein
MKNRTSTPAALDDLSPDPGIDTAERNRELDAELLKPGEEIAGMMLRPISAGDLALLMEAGVGLVVGKTDSLAYDVGAILWSQSQPREEVRALAVKKEKFRAAVLDFLDEFEPGLFQEATPRVVELVDRMNKARTAVAGTTSGVGRERPKKAGGRAG